MLTAELIRVLTNFAKIEPNFIAKPGNRCTTINSEKTIFACYEAEDQIWPIEFGIYDLNKFLSVVKLLTVVEKKGGKLVFPEIDFQENHMILRHPNGLSEIKFHYADTSVLSAPPTSPPTFPSGPSIVFKLTYDDINHLRAVSNELGCNHLVIKPENDEIIMKVTDINNPSTNIYTEVLDPNVILQQDSTDFEIIYDLQRWKLDSECEEYILHQSSKLISRFMGRTPNKGLIEYWIGQEFQSRY